MSKDLNMDVRVYPIDEPKGSTVAFASVTLCAGDEPVNAINSIRVVDSAKGAFVSLPQTQDKNGDYHDVAFPLNGDLRKELNKAVLNEYGKSMNVDRKPSIGDKIADGKAQAAQQQRVAAPNAAKKAPGLGD